MSGHDDIAATGAGRGLLIAAILMLLPIAAPASRAQTIDNAREYEECMALTKRDPQAAFDRAGSWEGLGGGEAAKHCAAAALIGLALYEEAATRLEALASTARRDAPFKAALLSQAAQAWLLAGNPAQAHSVLSTALTLDPNNAELLIDRSTALAALNNYAEARRDLDRAIQLSPIRAEAFAFRASALRILGDTAGAIADAERALQLDPTLPEALMERGNLRHLEGNDAGARSDWLKVLEVAPNSEAARTARDNIEKMDVRPEGTSPR